MDDFETFVKNIGIFCTIIILMGIPVITALSFIYNWYDIIKTVTVLLSILEAIVLYLCINEILDNSLF